MNISVFEAGKVYRGETVSRTGDYAHFRVDTVEDGIISGAIFVPPFSTSSTCYKESRTVSVRGAWSKDDNRRRVLGVGHNESLLIYDVQGSPYWSFEFNAYSVTEIECKDNYKRDELPAHVAGVCEKFDLEKEEKDLRYSDNGYRKSWWTAFVSPQGFRHGDAHDIGAVEVMVEYKKFQAVPEGYDSPGRNWAISYRSDEVALLTAEVVISYSTLSCSARMYTEDLVVYQERDGMRRVYVVIENFKFYLKKPEWI